MPLRRKTFPVKVGDWIKRVNRTGQGYEDRPVDLLRIEEVHASGVLLARFDGWDGENLKFGRTTHANYATLYTRRFAPASPPPVPPIYAQASGSQVTLEHVVSRSATRELLQKLHELVKIAETMVDLDMKKAGL